MARRRDSLNARLKRKRFLNADATRFRRMQFEPLECRRVLAQLGFGSGLSAAVVDGHLTINDDSPTGTNNQLVVSVSASDLVLSDAGSSPVPVPRDLLSERTSPPIEPPIELHG